MNLFNNADHAREKHSKQADKKDQLFVKQMIVDHPDNDDEHTGDQNGRQDVDHCFHGQKIVGLQIIFGHKKRSQYTLDAKERQEFSRNINVDLWAVEKIDVDAV